MKPTIFSHFRLPTLLLFTAIFSVPGCQTSKFPLPSLPGMSIWSSDKMDLTPRKLDTPSSQFHPEFVNKDDPASSAREDVQQKVDELILSAQKEKQPANQPLRQPYSLESIDPKMSQADTSLESNNSFEPVNTSQPKSPSANGFSMPGNQFKNLQNALDQLPPETIPQTSPSQPAPKNSIPGWNNDFAPGQTQPPQTPQAGSNATPSNGFQPIPTQSGTSSQPLSSAPAGTRAIPSNGGNGFDPPAMPQLNSSPAPHNLLQPAAPPTDNQFPATPQATIQLPLAPIQQSGQSIPVPDGGTAIIGGIKLPATPTEPARNVAPQADHSFGPIPFQKPEPAAEAIPGSLPVATPGAGIDLPDALHAETVKPTLEAKPSNGLPAALQMKRGGFAPGSIKQLKPADKN